MGGGFGDVRGAGEYILKLKRRQLAGTPLKKMLLCLAFLSLDRVLLSLLEERGRSSQGAAGKVLLQV